MIVPETRHVPYRATHAQTFFVSEELPPIQFLAHAQTFDRGVSGNQYEKENA